MRFGRLLSLVLMTTVLAGASATPCCGSTSMLLRSYGYKEIQPPSNLFQPGAIVAIAHQRPFKAALVCGPRGSLGAGWQPQESPTSSAMTNRLNGKSMKLDANWLDAIRTDGRFSSIESVVLTMNRARIVEVRDTDVIAGVRDRSSDCHEAIHARLSRGFTLTMIASSLSGDVTYSVRFSKDAGLEGRAKVDTLDQLALEMGGNATNITESEIRAVDLVWGVRDCSYLATLGIPDDILPTPAERPEGMVSLIPMAGRTDILPIPDAQVVMPSGRRPSLDGYRENLERMERTYRQPQRPLPDGALIFDPRRAPTQAFERQRPTERSPSLYPGLSHDMFGQPYPVPK